MKLEDKIKFAIPVDIIEKGTNEKGDKKYFIKGLASTNEKDRQGETLLANRFDLSDFSQLNWNHKGKDNPGAVLGHIDKHYFKPDGLHIEGELYPEMDMTKDAVSLMKAMGKRGKKMQLSVEGQVVERGHKDKKHPLYNKILKARLTGVALTPQAVNQNTFAELIEKGISVDEWKYDVETEELVKSMEAGTLTGTDTLNKESNGDALKKEDVEGKKNKHDIEKCEIPNCKQCLVKDKKSLSKSQAFESIFTYFCNVKADQAKQIYKIAEKISTMKNEKTISQETLNKAFDIIGLAEAQTSSKTTEDAIDLIKSEDFDGLEKAEVIEKLEKSGFDKKTAEEASEKEKPRKKKKVEGKKDEKKEGEKEEKDDDDDDKDNKKDFIKKSFDALMVKTDEFHNNSDLKLGAIGVILKSQNDMIEKLSESNEAITENLNKALETIEKISKTPLNLKKSISSTAIEKFEKGEEGEQIFNLNNKIHRKALADKLENLSQFNDGRGVNGSGKYDENLMKASQEIEMIGGFSNKKVIAYLQDVHKIKVVKE